MNKHPHNPLYIQVFRGFATLQRSAGLRSGILALAMLGGVGASQMAANVRVDLASGWNANQGREFPGAVGDVAPAVDGKQLIISYDFTNGGQYIAASHPLDKVEGVTSIKLKAVGPAHMSIGVKDASGQDFLYHIGMTASDEQSYTLDLSKPNKTWGGAGDKVMHYPLRSIRLLANKKPEVLKGKLVIKEIVLVCAP